jgi:hypothetical protein
MTAATSKTTASAEKSGHTRPLMVLGYDDQQKPRGARFQGFDAKLVTEAAKAMGLNVYEATTDELTALAKKLPVGRLYSTGKGFVPNIRQNLYSQVISALALEPKAAVGKDESTPIVASGLPKSWDDIAPGHLVIVEETAEYGWWPAVVIERNGDMLTMHFRDFPKLPKFARHRAAVALISTGL